jgi:hypothetical protein
MDSNSEEQMLSRFLEAAGSQPGSGGLSGMVEQLSALTGDAGSMTQSGEPQAATGNLFGDSASYVGASAHGEPIASSSTGVSSGSLATTFLESGLGVVPLITGLMGLFGGGSSEPAPLEKYEMPSAISFTSADTTNGLAAADFDQMGSPRLLSGVGDPQAGAGSSSGSTVMSGNSSGGAASAAAPITVNVQTMDARSFLDNSDQIAQAVRGAMLNLSSINDIVSELS